MANGKCTVRFLLYDKVKKSPKGLPIYCRITFQRKKALFATGEYCQPKNWNEEAGYPIRAPRTKEFLTFIENKIYGFKRQLEFEEKEITAAKLRDLYKGKDKKGTPKLLQYIDDYIQRISRLTQDYKAGTIRHYKTMRKHLAYFLEQENQTNLTIKQFSIEHIRKLDEFLMTTPTAQYNKPMGRNTANKYHTKLKTVLLHAQKSKLITFIPYADFPLKNKKVNREYLTKEELSTLEEFDFSFNDSLDKVKDIFLWSCYTGLRFTDAQSLTTKNINKDTKGDIWLAIEQQKTKEPLTIPLIDKAIGIYEKYSQSREITGFILPRLVNCKFQ